jgi:hypothetical protein
MIKTDIGTDFISDQQELAELPQELQGLLWQIREEACSYIPTPMLWPMTLKVREAVRLGALAKPDALFPVIRFLYWDAPKLPINVIIEELWSFSWTTEGRTVYPSAKLLRDVAGPALAPLRCKGCGVRLIMTTRTTLPALRQLARCRPPGEEGFIDGMMCRVCEGNPVGA